MRYILLLVLTLFGASASFGAESYPTGQVRVVVPWAAGGIADLTARAISQQLSVQLGKPFVVENRTGAGGTIGNAFVAKSAPDGYTLMLIDSSTTIAPGLYKSLPFDVARDYSAIVQMIRGPHVFVVNSSSSARTPKEFIALAQANPGKMNFGSGGVGSASHLSVELFKMVTRLNIVHVPYKGQSEATTALLGGELQMLITAIPAVLPHIKSGKLRALAVTAEGKREPSFPEVPSMSEAGISGMAVYGWQGLAGPASMPKEIVNRLYSETAKAMAVPTVREKLTGLGGEIVGSSPEEFSAYVRSELRRWSEVIKAAGITPE